MKIIFQSAFVVPILVTFKVCGIVNRFHLVFGANFPITIVVTGTGNPAAASILGFPTFGKVWHCISASE